MPLVRIALLRGKSPDYIRTIADSVHEALVECYGVSEGDRFQIVDQYDPETMIFDRNYPVLGVPRSNDFVLISVRGGPRSEDVKDAFYRRVVKILGEQPGLRREDVMVGIEAATSPEDWSFSHGVSAAELLRRSQS